MSSDFDVARAVGKSAAVLFVDITTAFVAARRDIPFGDGSVPESALSKLREFKWTTDDIDEVRYLFEDVIRSSAANGAWEASLAVRCHLFSWATVEGTSEVVLT